MAKLNIKQWINHTLVYACYELIIKKENREKKKERKHNFCLF